MQQALLSAVSFTSAPPTDEMQLKALLALHPPVEAVLGHSQFEEQLRSPSDAFIHYFAQPAVLRELLSLVAMGDIESSSRFTSVHAMNASQVLGLCNPKITLVLFSSKHLIASFFSLANLSGRTHATAQGYFLSICKALLGEAGVQKQIFLASLEIQKKKVVYGLVENLTACNAALIRALLAENIGLAQGTRTLLLDYLIFYYLNGKFADPPRPDFDPLVFDTLASLFRFLAAERIPYDFKAKYIDNLFDEKSIKPREYFGPLFHFRVSILRFLAEKGQLKKIDSPGHFLKRILEFAAKLWKPSLVLDGMSFFVALSKNAEFCATADDAFVAQLGAVLAAFPTADVLHQKVFDVAENLLVSVARKPQVVSALADLALKPIETGALPETGPRSLNPTALHFCAVFLFKVDRRDVSSALRERLTTAAARVSLILRKFEVHVFEGSLMGAQSQALQMLKSTDDIQRFLTELDGQPGSIERNILVTGEEVLEQKYRPSGPLGERDKEAAEGLRQLLVSQDLRPAEENTFHLPAPHHP